MTDEEKAAKEHAEAERKAKAEAKKAEQEKKAKEREEAKAAREKEKAEAKTKREQEKIEKEAKDAELDLSTVKGTGDGNAVTLKDVREAVKAKRAEERANRPKKAPLTLSQRRALLRLAEDGQVVPKTAFNALPLDHLVNVGLAEKFDAKRTETYFETESKEVDVPKAEREEGGPTTKTVKEKVEKTREVDATGFRLTDSGRERAGEINPKWLTWKPDVDGASAQSTAEPESETVNA